MNREVFNKLEYLDHLIRKRATGSPKELALRLKLSERGTYNYLNLFKNLGAPIKFDKNKRSYFYTEEGNFNFRFQNLLDNKV